MPASSDEWHGMLKMTRTHSQGYVQRASATSVGEPAITPYSNLARYLLEEYAFGGISASQLQQIALMAEMDNLTHPQVVKLANLGTRGRHPGNVDRDLRHYVHQTYLHSINLPAAESYPLPFKVLKGKSQGTQLLPSYYKPPHKLISFIYTNLEDEFKNHIL